MLEFEVNYTRLQFTNHIQTVRFFLVLISNGIFYVPYTKQQKQFYKLDKYLRSNPKGFIEKAIYYKYIRLVYWFHRLLLRRPNIWKSWKFNSFEKNVFHIWSDRAIYRYKLKSFVWVSNPPYRFLFPSRLFIPLRAATSINDGELKKLNPFRFARLKFNDEKQEIMQDHKTESEYMGKLRKSYGQTTQVSRCFNRPWEWIPNYGGGFRYWLLEKKLFTFRVLVKYNHPTENI